MAYLGKNRKRKSGRGAQTPASDVATIDPADPAAHPIDQPAREQAAPDAEKSFIVMSDAGAHGSDMGPTLFSFGVSVRTSDSEGRESESMSLSFSIDSGRPQTRGNSVMEAEAGALWVGMAAAREAGASGALSMTDSKNLVSSLEKTRAFSPRSWESFPDLPPTPSGSREAMESLAALWLDNMGSEKLMPKMKALIIRDAMTLSGHGVSWTPRAGNQRADRLAAAAAKNALSEGADFSCPRVPDLAARIFTAFHHVGKPGTGERSVAIAIDARPRTGNRVTRTATMDFPDGMDQKDFPRWMAERVAEEVLLETSRVRKSCPDGDVVVSSTHPGLLSRVLSHLDPETSSTIRCVTAPYGKSTSGKSRRLRSSAAAAAEAAAGAAVAAAIPDENLPSGFHGVVAFCSRIFRSLFPGAPAPAPVPAGKRGPGGP